MSERKPYHLNVIGPFYVEDSCCTSCGVPWDRAPRLFDWNEEQCWVKQQPRDDAELDTMLDVMSTQELGCIRYRGDNPDLLRRLSDLGEAASCDHIAEVVRAT